MLSLGLVHASLPLLYACIEAALATGVSFVGMAPLLLLVPVLYFSLDDYANVVSLRSFPNILFVSLP